MNLRPVILTRNPTVQWGREDAYKTHDPLCQKIAERNCSNETLHNGSFKPTHYDPPINFVRCCRSARIGPVPYTHRERRIAARRQNRHCTRYIKVSSSITRSMRLDGPI